MQIQLTCTPKLQWYGPDSWAVPLRLLVQICTLKTTSFGIQEYKKPPGRGCLYGEASLSLVWLSNWRFTKNLSLRPCPIPGVSGLNWPPDFLVLHLHPPVALCIFPIQDWGTVTLTRNNWNVAASNGTPPPEFTKLPLQNHTITNTEQVARLVGLVSRCRVCFTALCKPPMTLGWLFYIWKSKGSFITKDKLPRCFRKWQLVRDSQGVELLSVCPKAEESLHTF